MKFLLIMQVCSSIHLSCMNEMPAGEYKTHFDCATQVISMPGFERSWRRDC